MKTTRPNKDSTGGGFVNDEITTGGMTDKEQNEIVRKFLKTNIIRKTDEPRNIREVKVGDIVHDNGTYMGTVIEVLENMFALSNILNSCEFEKWETFKCAENMGWEIKEGSLVVKGGKLIHDYGKPIMDDEGIAQLERHHQNILDGVDDSEEVEFSKQELEDMKTITEAEIIRQRSYGFKTDAPGLLTIKSKLNKMLKDKGEE